jgi:hypothetical protein
MKKMSEKKLIRDYAYEHQLRTKKKKRFVCDIEKEKAQNFEAVLQSQDTTFSKWLHDRINEYMNEAK